MPKHTPDRTLVVGLAWFDRKQWQRLTEAAEDRNELDDTYEQWQQSALDAVQMIERQGQKVERVHVEVESLVSSCKEKWLPVNGKSRAEYVTQLMRRRHGTSQGLPPRWRATPFGRRDAYARAPHRERLGIAHEP